MVRDLNYFNKNYNPGDAIEVDVDFRPDVAELSLPPEYSDEPPDQEDELDDE